MKKKGLILISLFGICSSLLLGCNEEPTITPINADFDFDILNDVTFELNAEVESISHLRGHNISEGDYVIASQLLTIDKNYLVKLAPGTYEYEVLFSNRSEKISLNILNRNNQHRIINCGFETGDFFGWQKQTVFKGEDNLSSFSNSSLVINENIADSDQKYNGGGDYVYGIPQQTSKTVWEERMGRLVSSSFVLSASGYLSFKMGGGKNSDLSYISVIDDTNNQELVRYGNHLFNYEASGYQNATLHSYQADLSAHRGKTMHIEIVDLGGRDWDFLTLDDLETYLVEPSSSLETAIDIKPNATQGYAPNQIVNGDFADGLNGWQISNKQGWAKSDGSSQTWHVQNGVLRSDLTGDSARGLLRSSFFRVDGSGVISMEIGAAQGSRFDKDTFVSIRERATNQEIFRTANTRHDGIFLVQYFIDLSDYMNRVLYFEIIDNATGSYDTIFIDNIITYYETRPEFDFGNSAVNLNY
ncbi:MAG: hypothetical protein PHV19_01130 [Bacilli bacterium]|nr:hypothetical protein [Bacilli bacterium]